MYVLNQAYEIYFIKSQKHLSNKELQKRIWDAREAYYPYKDSARNFDTEYYRTFDSFFEIAVSRFGVKRCLDIGCGGFQHILRINKKFPNLEFIGNDISNYSKLTYEKEISKFSNITFVEGNVLDNQHILQ